MDPKLKQHLDRILADLQAEDVAITDLRALQALLAQRTSGDLVAEAAPAKRWFTDR
jgi:hypothetical protein